MLQYCNWKKKNFEENRGKIIHDTKAQAANQSYTSQITSQNTTKQPINMVEKINT